MVELFCVGEMVIDFLPGTEAGVYIRKAGGAPANVAVAAARNGIEAGFCGRVGNDHFGRFLISTLEENRVKVLCPELMEEAITTMAFVSLDEKGDRSFTFARKPGADMFLTCKDVECAGVKDAQMIHAGSCSLSENPAAEATVYALKTGHLHEKLVSFDVNYRNLMWKDDREACMNAIQEILSYVDFLKISEEEEDMLGVTPEEAVAKYNIAVLVETLGSKGAKCIWNNKILTVSGRKTNCVDATGAGDAFWGGFLSCIFRENIKKVEDLTEEVLLKALQHGNIAGSLCVQKKGAMESLPVLDDILAIMKEEA